MFSQNQEYKFDEDKSVICELEDILGLLTSKNHDFWNLQLENLILELQNNNKKRQISAIQLIKDLNYKNAENELMKILEIQNDQIVIYEAILALISLGSAKNINNIDEKLSKITDENLLAVIKNVL